MGVGSGLFSAMVAAMLLPALPALAQQQAQPSAPPQQQGPQQAAPAASQPQQAAPAKKDQDKNGPQEQNGVSNDRLFWTLPDFLTIESEGKIPPLTTGQEFRVVTRESFDYSTIPYVLFVAGLSQANNSERGYGQGWGGYGKRVASAFGDATIENYMTGAILPALLREDPRYYQMGKGGFWRRAGYSASRIVVTRTDAGHTDFNYSEIAGAAVAAGVSNIYHPNTDRNVSSTLSTWGSQIAWDTFTIEMKEFWPDIRRSVSRHRNKEQTP